jgi:drug/metabolite transporter (DMT)-like permease
VPALTPRYRGALNRENFRGAGSQVFAPRLHGCRIDFSILISDISFCPVRRLDLCVESEGPRRERLGMRPVDPAEISPTRTPHTEKLGAMMQQRTNWLKTAGAFAAIYLLWGATYLAIALGLRSIPAFMLIASRSLLGGAVLLLTAYVREPGLRSIGDWGRAAVGGAFFFIGCHGALAYAERQVPSGLAAVLLATIPFWIVLANSVAVHSEPIAKLLELLPGFGGVALIAWQDVSSSTRPLSWTMILLLLASALSWALGTVYSQRRTSDIPSDHLAAMQLVCGGAGLLVVSALAGEWKGFAFADVTLTSMGGMLYLALLGSVVGNTAYLWLLERMSAPIVATYTFVNPIIALLLGWWVLGEQITWTSLLAAALVVSSIIMLLALPYPRREAC